MTTNVTYSRVFDGARQRQGFVSQAQLDAFFAYYDHVSGGCDACKARNSWVELSDGIQPTRGECDAAQELYRAYLATTERADDGGCASVTGYDSTLDHSAR
jgi:hypothetical protein